MRSRAAVPGADAAQLRAAFEGLSPLSPEDWAAVVPSLRLVDVPRGAPLFEAGVVVDGVHFLRRGVVRLVRREGDQETTLGFDRDGRFVTDLESFLTGGPARTSAEALEDVRSVFVSRDVLDALSERSRAWERLRRRAMEAVVLRKIDKERRIRARSAEERYRDLQSEGSWLLERVPQYHLAAYLGIAPETLSRIRRRS